MGVRNVRAIAVALLVMLIAAACGGATEDGADDTSARSEGAEGETNGGDDSEAGGEPRELLIYHSQSPDEIAPMIEGFTAYYEEEVGGEVLVEDFHQPGGELQATIDLEVQGDSLRADVVVSSSASMIALEEDHGIFEPIDLSFTDDDAIPQSFRDASERSGFIPMGIQPYIVAYNTEQVAEDEVPTSWEDLLDDRWQGVIGMGDPETTNGAHITVWFLAKHLAETVGDPYGWGYFERLGELDVTTANSHDTIMEFVASGELHVGILGLGTATQSAIDGNQVAAVVPEEGVSGIPVAVGVVEGSDDPELARMYAEWTASQEGQTAMHEGSRFLSIRDDVELEPPPFPLELDVSRVFPLDDQWVAEEREDNIARFREAIGG